MNKEIREQQIKKMADIINTCPIKAEEKGFRGIIDCGRISCGNCAAEALIDKGYVKAPETLPLISDEEISATCKKLTEAAESDEIKCKGINEATYDLVHLLLQSQRDADLKAIKSGVPTKLSEAERKQLHHIQYEIE